MRSVASTRTQKPTAGMDRFRVRAEIAPAPTPPVAQQPVVATPTTGPTAPLDSTAKRAEDEAPVVLSAGIDGKDTARLADLIEQFELVGLDGKPSRAPGPADRYGLFRFDPRRNAGRG